MAAGRASPGTVLVLKEEDAALRAALAPLPAAFVPVIETRRVPCEIAWDQHRHVVITSGRVLQHVDVLHREGRVYWVVGRSTGDKLRRKLRAAAGEGAQLDIRGEGSGAAGALAAALVAYFAGVPSDADEGSALWLTGHDRRKDLPGTLAAHKIPFTTAVCYDTVPVAAEAAALPPSSSIAAVALYSKHGIPTALRVKRDTPGVAVACIGPTTAASAVEAGLDPACTAREPTAAALAEAIRTALAG
eukprot:TRINITY_DN7594_c0_g1_i1.p1 TRINITY_DN7594_c0_g1~~TRINITY_DN7594_c0_g1_i1.p1  ORF type:complete len:264 (+),score=80.57 TRINITY_DN7594_c0_g1_i1:55-792(+)